MPFWSSQTRNEWEEHEARFSPLGPYRSCTVVTPSDTVDLPAVSRALYAPSAGQICVLFADDQPGQQQIIKVTAGQTLPICVRRIYRTGTALQPVTGSGGTVVGGLGNQMIFGLNLGAPLGVVTGPPAGIFTHLPAALNNPSVATGGGVNPMVFI